MEAKMIHSVQSCTWLNGDKMMRKPGGLIGVPQRSMGKKGINMSLFVQTNAKSLARRKRLSLKVSSSLKNSSGSVLVSGGSPATLDESLALKNKSLQIEPYLNGRSIYLVGMMGSGKTTIGRLLAEVLGYSFFDSDTLVEILGGLSVAEMFEQHGEGFFRDKETEVLQEVSMNHHLVISTGGGAVIRPINWKHMRSGISVWLDVPIDCLARRISAVGTGSRPLLHGETGDAYTTAYKRLSTIFEERHEAYANANARVSLEYITAKLGNVEVDNVTPAVIAIEVLEQIESFLKDDDLAI